VGLGIFTTSQHIATNSSSRTCEVILLASDASIGKVPPLGAAVSCPC